MTLQHKKKILVFVDWYLPGYKAGGPIRSVANLVKSLSNELDFRIVTSDFDFGSTTGYPGVTTGQWMLAPDGTNTYYIPGKRLSYAVIRRIIRDTDFDILYLNSFFSYYFSILPAVITRLIRKDKKIILAPRGMLGEGALKLKSGKKRLFISLARLFGIYRNITWHASTEMEAEEIRSVFGRKQDVRTAVNIFIGQPDETIRRSKEKARLRLVFFSRVSPKKNLKGAIEILKAVKGGVHIEFDVFGPVEDQVYWKSCQNEANALPSGISMNYKGEVPYYEVPGVFDGYHFLFLPTYNENFGHIILESLCRSCPVIISDQTPWKELEDKKIGWDIPIGNIDAFVRAIETCAEMDQQAYDRLSQSAGRFAMHYIQNNEAISENRKLFG